MALVLYQGPMVPGKSQNIRGSLDLVGISMNSFVAHLELDEPLSSFRQAFSILATPFA